MVVTALRAGLVAWVATGALLTAVRAHDWGVGETRLWAQAHARAPQRVRPLVNFASAELGAGFTQEARDLYDAAVVLAVETGDRDGEIVARANRIIFDARTGDRANARARFAELIGDFPGIDRELLARLEAATR